MRVNSTDISVDSGDNSGQRSLTLAYVKPLVVLGVIAALLVTNVLTLVDDGFHAKAFSFLRSIPFVPDLKNSPHERRKVDVDAATRLIVDEKKVLAIQAASLASNILQLKIERENIIKSHNTERDRSQKATEKHKASVSRFSGQLTPRMAKLVGRNVSSLAAEAVPMAGIAVLVTVTGWDVYDACQTMKDLNQLNENLDLPHVGDAAVCGVHVPTVDEIKDMIKW